MIVKTIAADHQLEIRKSSSPTRSTSITEKSYLRSQFERRQKRQIELTNKMNQQKQLQLQQPDSAVRSHELIKRRFFEKLERRESMNLARGTIGAAAAGAATANKQNELEQVRRQLHQQHQQLQSIFASSFGENQGAGGSVSNAKVDSVNEADGAGTDADDAEATSLETIITNNFKSNGTLVTATVAQALCETAAQEEPPPLDDSKIDDDDEQQVEEGRAGVSNEDDHERQQQQRQSSGGQCRVDHDDVSSALLNLQETARVEQASGFSPLVQQQKRQPSKRDLHDGLLLLPLEDAREVGEHERLRLLQSGSTAQQQQQRGEQREQYANPSSWPSDSSQGNHLVRRPSSGNNVNHDQTDGHCRDLTYSLHATQMFTGRGGNHFGDVKNNVDGRINFVDRSTSGGHDDLIEPLRQEDSKMQQPRKILLDQETTSKKYGNDNICDTDQRQAIVVISSPTIERAIEEDVGSSCSSSGFGASVSAGSSSASSSSDGHHHRHHHLSADDKESMLDNLRGQNDHYRRPNSVGYVVGQDGEILESKSQSEMGADEIAKFEIVVGRHDDPDSTGPYKQILSVDYNQAYQDDDEDDNDGNGGGRPLLHVENHGYGSLVNGCRTITIAAGATMRNQTDRRRWPLVDASEVSSELDLYSNRQYVNLPTDSVTNSAETQDSSTATAGYATVRAQQPLVHNSRGQSAGLANIPSTGNNRYSTDHQPDVKLNSNNNDQHHSTTTTMMTMKSATATKTRGELEGRESSLSGHSSSSSSANTGGFSKLPPVRLIDHHFANNFESSKAPPGREPKSLPQSSLLLLPSSSSLMEESNSMQQQSKKSPSFLKRFGSLVSRAFTLNSSSGGGGEFGSSGSNFDYHNHGIRGNITQANAGSGGGSRLEMQHQQSASSESMPPLKKQELHELRNGAGSQAEHKSAENAIGGSRQGGVDNNNETHSPKLADNSNLRGERLNLNPLKGPVVVAGNKPSSIMAQADLVILSSKHSKNNQLASRAKNLTATDDDHHHYGAASQRLRRDPIEGSGNLRNCRPRSDDKFLARMKHHRSRNACANESRKLAHRTSATYLSRRSTSSTSCSSLTSLDNSSLTSTSSTRDLTHRAGVPSSSSRLRRQRSAKRTSSLSDDLESLLSPSEVVSAQRIREDQLYPTEKCDKNRATAATTTTTTNLTQKRRPIMNKNHETDRESNKGRMNASDNINKSQRDQASSKSRSIMRWFNATGGSASSSPSPLMADSMQKDDCNSIRYDPTGWACETRREPQGLIDPSHANRGYKLDCSTGNSKILRRLSKENSGTLNVRGQPTSLIYTSLNQHSRSLHSDNEQPKQSWRKRMDADRSSPDHKDKPNDEELVVIDGKCQSLNIYSNLLRNYVKRRNHRGHHHHHHRHHHQHTGHHNRGHHHHHYHAHSSSNSSNHHHHHHNKHSSSSRHAHCSSSTETGATTTRCGQQRCGSPDRACSYSSERLVAGSGKTHGDKASVWGQLIKINKSDGSQVIELQRAPGRSWGFFVARGAINNKKGIFISRMHDSSTGNSLSGLLSIGDQILSIDNYIIEPDFDILRVNQMISKKTEILLGVKPFKG